MRYDPRAIESKWQKRWLKEKTYEPDFLRARRPFYNLMMFPYPSAEGLHVGNMYAFTGADIFGRFQRMHGQDVFEPIGLDGFGIHSENYALKLNKHPADQAKVSEKNFYRQLQMLGNSFAWEERLETYDPDYYRWTQWIFTEMFRRGLAYRKKSPVNWCPSCKTVLADEQVIQKSQIPNSKFQTNSKSQIPNQKHKVSVGVCERCETPVLKKDLEQWFFRITRYAGRLLKNLDKIDWSERIKIAQRNWIGRSEGAEIEFRIQNLGSRIRVFTTRPDTLFGATYMALAPEHPLIQNLESGIKNLEAVRRYIRRAKEKKEDERIAAGKVKTGVELKGVKVINPANGKAIPVWVADYVLGSVGTGALFGDAHDERDVAFAKKYRIPLKPTLRTGDGVRDARIRKLQECFTGDGILFDSGKFSGLRSAEARVAITAWLAKKNQGKRTIQYRLRDWLISRQRYWGPPIPIIYCRKCWEITNHKSQITNKSKTQNSKPREGIDYAVFDGKEHIIHPVPAKDLPVKLPYIKNFRPTGTEKSPLATVEKFYRVRCPKCRAAARRETDVSDTFLDSAWYYLRYPSLRAKTRPWDKTITKKWFPVDMYIGGAEHAVLHLLYVRFLALAFHDWGLTHFEEPFKKFRAHGLLVSGGAKMSKSRGNVVNPDEYVRAYGADALRMYLMFLGPFEQGGDFRDTGIRGITRFLERVWRLAMNQESGIKNHEAERRSELERIAHRAIRKITDDIGHLQYNTAISALMVLLNALEGNPNAVAREHISVFLRLLAPFAPHMSEELWRSALGEKASIHKSRWPEADDKFLRSGRMTIVIQVNGKVRDRMELDAGTNDAAVRELALARPQVKEWLQGRPVKKLIYVPKRLVSIVV